MSKSKRANRYTPEFRQQMIDHVRAGRKISELAREFGCTSWTITRWVKRSDQEPGAGQRALSASDREELLRLRQENRQLKIERDLLSKAAAWFAQEKATKSPK
jgi:transposase